MFSTKDSDDEKYLKLAKNPDANEAELRKMVDNAAREAGYNSPILYHGTYNFGKTVFDLYNVLFLTDNIGTARNFSGGQGQRYISEKFNPTTASDEALIKYAENNTYASNIKKATATDFENEIARVSLTAKEAKEYYGTNWQKALVESNKRIITVKQRYKQFKSGIAYFAMNSNSIAHDYPNNPLFDRSVLEEFVSKYVDKQTNGGVYSVYGKLDNMLSIECNESYYTEISLPGELMKYATANEKKRGYATSDQIVRMAINANYTAVEFNNMREGGDYGDAGVSNVYAVFNPTENVKSADLVTYDNKGNIIPLSERFNSENDDIRYSFKGEQSEMAALEKKNLSIAKQMESEGLYSEKIRLATGWFKSYDGKWRYEINDSEAKFLLDDIVSKTKEKAQKEIQKIKDDYKAGKFGKQAYQNKMVFAEYRLDNANRQYTYTSSNYKLKDLLYHPKLFKAYPKLKDVDVGFDVSRQGDLGYTSGAYSHIGLHENLYYRKEEALEVLMHEIQHQIQDIEGFARGTNLTEARIDKEAEINKKTRELKAQVRDIEDEGKAKIYNYLRNTFPNSVNYTLYGEDFEGYAGQVKEYFDNKVIRFFINKDSAIDNVDYAYSKAKEYAEFDQKIFDEIDEISDKISKLKSKIKSIVDEVNSESDFDRYQRAAGEIESRDVSSRIKYDDATRKSTRPDIDRTNARLIFDPSESKSEGEDIRYSLKAVEPVRPTNNGWERSLTTDEVKKEHPTLWDVSAEESEVRNPTQVKVTVSSYKKIYDYLKSIGFNGTILDASSGLGYGTKAGIDEYGFDVEDIEPYPDSKYKPKYTDYSKLNKKYDAIISNAVLNVLPQDQRDALVLKMGELLNDGGMLFINTRGDDVMNASSKEIINAKNLEVFISKSGSYQKGFTPNELKAYIEDALGDGYDVQKTTMFGKSAVIVTKDANYTEENDIRYSKKKDSKGSYWQIDTDKDIFSGINDIPNLIESAYKFIINLRDSNEAVYDKNGNKITAIKISAKKMTRNNDKLKEDNYKRKLRIIPSIADLISNESIFYHSPDMKDHNLFKEGFDNHRGRVGIDNVIFQYNVEVGVTKWGRVFYELKLEVDSILPHGKTASELFQSTSNKNKLPQNSPVVNTQEENSTKNLTKTVENGMDSLKSVDDYSDRQILVNALDSTLDTSTKEGQEKHKLLKRYKENIGYLNEQQEHLDKVSAEIKKIEPLKPLQSLRF